MRRLDSCLVLLAAATFVVPAEAQTIAITGGKVYPVSGPPIEHGTVLMRDGKIVAVGANVDVPAGATRVDATGKWVTPGLVDAGNQLGLVEIEAVADTRDDRATGTNGIAAAFRAWEGFNSTSVSVRSSRNEGVTSVVVFPQGGLVAGQVAVLDLADGSPKQMLVRAPVSMLGDASRNVAARAEALGRWRALLDDVRYYARHRAEFDRSQARVLSAPWADLEALMPVVDGKLPLVLYADKSTDIENALALAKEYALKLIIIGGAEAWMVAPQLAAAKVPVLTGAMNNIPSSFETLGQRQENAGLLRAAGVEVVLIGNAGGGDEDAFNVRNIKYEAGNAVAYGMKWDDALRAITLGPAEVFGVGDRVGSLRSGRDADVVVWNGDPFEFATRAEQVYIRGKRMSGDSRQDQLIKRYQQLPPKWGPSDR